MPEPVVKATIEYRQLVERHVERIVLRPKIIEVLVRGEEPEPAGEQIEDQGADEYMPRGPDSITLALPWSAPVSIAAKGILHEPEARKEMTLAARDALLTAIGKARCWIDDLVSGKAASFAEIAEREGKVERHIRFLAPLAFVSPGVIAAIANKSALPLPKLSVLAKVLPLLWAEQRGWLILTDEQRNTLSLNCFGLGSRLAHTAVIGGSSDTNTAEWNPLRDWRVGRSVIDLTEMRTTR